MSTPEAKNRAARNYRARQKAKATNTKNPNSRRKPASATARTWNSQQFAGSRPSKFKLPENHSRCSHCGGWNHLAWDHMDQHQFRGSALIDRSESARRAAAEEDFLIRNVTGKPGPWRVIVFQKLGEFELMQQPTKSLLRQAAEQIALIRKSRQTVPSEQRNRFTKSLIRELRAEETLRNVRTLVPVAEDNGNTAWVIDAEGMANYTPLLVSDRFDSVFVLAEPIDPIDRKFEPAEVA
jgi:hypothetical protein